MKRSLLLSISVLALIASPAYAVDLSDAKAQELKDMLNSFVDIYKQNPLVNNKYTFNGEVSVEQGDGFFKASLPSVTYNNEDKIRLDIGQIAINAIPMEKNNEWQMAISLPSNITAYDDTNTAIGSIDIGKQQFGGVFNKDFKNFSKLKASYDNVVMTSLKNNLKATLPELSLFYKFEDSKEGFLSGPMEYTLTGLNIKEDNNVIFKAEELVLSGAFKDFDIKMQENILSQLEGIDSEQEDPSELNTQTLFNLLTDSYFKGSDAFSINLSGKNIAFTPPQPSLNSSLSTESSPDSSTQLNAFNFGLAMSDLRQEKSKINLSVGYDKPQDAKSRPPHEIALLSLIPNNTNIDINFNNIPVQKLVQIGQNAFKQATLLTQQGQSPADALKMQLLMSLPQILTTSGAQIEIKDISAENSKYTAKISGTAIANSTASKMVTASLNAELSGLSTMASLLGKTPRTQPFVAPLSMLQMMGQKKGNTDKYSYDLKLNEQGTLTVNDVDVLTMLGMGSNPASGQ